MDINDAYIGSGSWGMLCGRIVNMDSIMGGGSQEHQMERWIMGTPELGSESQGPLHEKVDCSGFCMGRWITRPPIHREVDHWTLYGEMDHQECFMRRQITFCMERWITRLLHGKVDHDGAHSTDRYPRHSK